MFTVLARDNARLGLFGIVTFELKKTGIVHVSNVLAAAQENYIN